MLPELFSAFLQSPGAKMSYRMVNSVHYLSNKFKFWNDCNAGGDCDNNLILNGIIGGSLLLEEFFLMVTLVVAIQALCCNNIIRSNLITNSNITQICTIILRFSV